MITYQLPVDLVAALGAAGRVRHVLAVLLDPQSDETVAAAAAAASCTIHGCRLQFSLLPRAPHPYLLSMCMITCERGFHRAGGDRVVVARAGGAGGRRGGRKRKKGRKEKGGYEEEQLIKIWRQEFHVSIALTEAIERGKGEKVTHVHTKHLWRHAIPSCPSLRPPVGGGGSQHL